MKYEFLQEQDIKELLQLIQESFGLVGNEDSLKNSFLTNNPKFLVAKKDDLLVGAVMITTKKDCIKNIEIYELDYVCVLPSYQNQKIGTHLLQEVETLAKKNHIAKITFTSNRKRIYARQMYAHLGYELKDTGYFEKYI